MQSWGRDTDHIEKGFVFGGMPARNGVTAALLVQRGLEWRGRCLLGRGQLLPRQRAKGQSRGARRGLGERYEIVNTDIKKWTVGTPIQAPLDAIENLRRKRAFDADDVKEVVVQACTERRVRSSTTGTFRTSACSTWSR